MKRFILIAAFALVASAASAQYVDDLYSTTAAKKKSSSKSAPQSTAQQPQKTYSSTEVAPNTDNQELITSYEQALERRIGAMRNASEQGDEYWQFMQQYQALLEAKYNRNLYNIVVVGNEMWVEPQAITALFDGSDPAQGVVKYNDEIRGNLSSKSSAKSNRELALSGGGGSGASNITINIVVDPYSWNWGYPGYSYYRPFNYFNYYDYYGHYSYYDPWYNPYWGGGYYRPYYYRPYYHQGYNQPYYGNARGTYYGNSRSAYNERGSQQGMGAQRSNRSSMGNGRSASNRYMPTGANTVNGLSNRRDNGSIRTTVPMGGVSTNRGAGDRVYVNSTPRRTGVSFGGSSSSGYERPSSGRTPTNYSRPSSEQRPAYERPSYERNTSTYERPSSERSSPSTISRPSSGFGTGGAGGGGSRSGGSSMGGGRRR